MQDFCHQQYEKKQPALRQWLHCWFPRGQQTKSTPRLSNKADLRFILLIRVGVVMTYFFSLAPRFSGFSGTQKLYKNDETCCAVALHTQVVVNGVSLKRSFLDDFWTCMKFVTFKRSRGCSLNFEEWQMFSLWTSHVHDNDS